MTFRPIPRAEGGYRCAVIDPPWSFDDKVTRNAPELSVGSGYGTLSTAEIAELPVPELLAPSALVFLWAPDTHIFEAKWLLDWWGLGYKHLAVWVKTYGATDVEEVEGEGDLDCGMGNYMRKSHEVALLAATPGLRARSDIRDRRARSVVVAPRRRHSEKPEELQDAAERLISGPYLELFARRRRPGWTCWGDELTEE